MAGPFAFARPLPIALVLSLVAAGCVTPDEVESASADLATDASAGAGGVAQEIAFDGALGAGAVACPIVICASAYPVPNDRLYEAATGAGTFGIDVTLEWAPSSPHNERLVLGAFTCDPDACSSDADLSWSDAVVGPSPLSFGAGNVEVAEGETLYVFVNPVPTATNGVVFARASTPQDFAIRGTLMSQEREATSG